MRSSGPPAQAFLRTPWLSLRPIDDGREFPRAYEVLPVPGPDPRIEVRGSQEGHFREAQARRMPLPLSNMAMAEPKITTAMTAAAWTIGPVTDSSAL